MERISWRVHNASKLGGKAGRQADGREVNRCSPGADGSEYPWVAWEQQVVSRVSCQITTDLPTTLLHVIMERSHGRLLWVPHLAYSIAAG